MREPTACGDARAGGVRAGEEHAVDAAARAARRRPSPAPTSGDEHVAAARRPRAAAARCAGRSASRTPTACRAPRCRSAAPARTRCSRRSTDSSRPRCWRRRRAARGRCARACRRRRTPSRSRSRGSTSARKKSMRPSRPLSSLRDCADRLADLARQGRGERLELARRRAARKRCDARLALGQRPRRPGRLRGARARAPWRRRWRRRRPALRRSARRWRGCVIFRAWLMAVGVAARAARARGSRRAAARRRACPSPRAVELGMPLHRRHDRLAAAAGGSPRSCRRSAQRASTTKPRREVLDGLVVDAVDRRRARRPR